MPKKKTEPRPVLDAPNAGELDVYSVLWGEKQGDNEALKLNDVWKRVCERRRSFGEPEPAMTTVSTHLRGLVRKELAQEVTGSSRATAAPVRTRGGLSRGGLTPATRSPLTSYRALHTPGEVLYTTFLGLASTYPDQLDALYDFACALDVSEEGLGELEILIGKEKARSAKSGK